MARITYIGVDGAADPNGTHQFGIDFPVNKAVEVTDKKVIAKLDGHPHFKLTGSKAEKTETPDPATPDKLEAVKAEGARAKTEGKDRSVPVAYRGKPQEAAWLAGYDGAGG